MSFELHPHYTCEGRGCRLCQYSGFMNYESNYIQNCLKKVKAGKMKYEQIGVSKWPMKS